jgi:hypothetical protein
MEIVKSCVVELKSDLYQNIIHGYSPHAAICSKHSYVSHTLAVTIYDRPKMCNTNYLKGLSFNMRPLNTVTEWHAKQSEICCNLYCHKHMYKVWRNTVGVTETIIGGMNIALERMNEQNIHGYYVWNPNVMLGFTISSMA